MDLSNEILCGDVTFALQNGNNGDKIWYNITKSPAHENMFNVFCNMVDKTYSFIGTYFRNEKFVPRGKWEKMTYFARPKQIRLIDRFLKNIKNVPTNLFVIRGGNLND